MAPLSLPQLLELTFVQPKASIVDPDALYRLLQGILRHLGLWELTGQQQGHSPTQPAGAQPAEAPPGPQEAAGGAQAWPQGQGSRGQEAQEHLLQGTTSSPRVASTAADVGEMEEGDASGVSQAMALSQNVPEEISRLKAAQARMAEEIRAIQKAFGLGNLGDAAGQLPGHRGQQTIPESGVARPQAQERLKEGLSLCLAPEEEGSGGQSAPAEPQASAVDRLHGASSALGLKEPGTQPAPSTSKGTAATKPGSPGTDTPPAERAPVSPQKWAGAPSDQARTSDGSTTSLGTQPESPGIQVTLAGVQPEAPSTQTAPLEMQPALQGTQGGGAGVQPGPLRTDPSPQSTMEASPEATIPAQGTQVDAAGPMAAPSTQPAGAGQPATGTSWATAQGLEMPHNTVSPLQEPEMGLLSADTAEEALRQVGQLGLLYTSLKEQVAQLEATKAGREEVEKLSLEEGKESISSILVDLQDRVSSLQGLAGDLQGEKGKIRQLEDALRKLREAGSTCQEDGSKETTLHLGTMLQEVQRELRELREQQLASKATVEQRVTEVAAQLQEQLAKLKAMVRGVGQEHPVCPVCNTDAGVQLEQLLRRFKKLQKKVDSMSQQAVDNVARQLPERSQDKELLEHIQASVTRVQEDCDKMNRVTGNLLADCRQKQGDIEVLFQSLERLQRDKAAKEDLELELEVKADKAALATKVSCTQFEANIERLYQSIEEVRSQVTSQGQGWQQVQQRLGEEMDSKLDRLELGPFRQELEKNWKRSLKELREKMSVPEPDSAAGIKKQLLAPFNCLSCSRPLNMPVPGPTIHSLPLLPPLPPCPAAYPHTAAKAERIQQQGRRKQKPNYQYPTVPRQCGGQHTRGPPLQRCPTHQPHPQLPIQHDEEVELLGSDGRIYRGRRSRRKEGTDASLE